MNRKLNLLLCFCISGFRKKLEAAAKKKGCSLIREWQRSILNHLYWCVASTEDGDGETILAKWLSLDNHVHNQHTHASPRFRRCVHGRLSKRKWFQRRKFKALSKHDVDLFMCLCLQLDTKPSEAISALISDKNLCKAIRRLSPVHQTSSLESFHSVLNHFAPKMQAFYYPIMNSRLESSLIIN